jgi:hypothetical protein
MNGHGLRKEQFVLIAPTLVGLTMPEAAAKVFCAPVSLYKRFHNGNFNIDIEGGIFTGIIKSIELPGFYRFDLDAELSFSVPNRILKTEAPVIRLPSVEYDQLVSVYRRKHSHRLNF